MATTSLGACSILWIDSALAEYEDVSRAVTHVRTLLADRIHRVVNIDTLLTLDSAQARLNTLIAPPDVIIMELQLSPTAHSQHANLVDMNAGFKLWCELRQRADWAKTIPIVVATNRCAIGLRDIMTRDQHLRYIELPTTPGAVAEAIHSLLSRS